MAAIKTEKNVVEKNNDLILSAPMAAATKIYKGAMVKLNAAGYAAPMAAEPNAEFAGIAVFTQDNTAGAAGDLEIQFWTEGVYQLTSTGLTIADVGKVVYASTDQDVSLTQGSNELKVGRIVPPFVAATNPWVKIDSATQ